VVRLRITCPACREHGRETYCGELFGREATVTTGRRGPGVKVADVTRTEVHLACPRCGHTWRIETAEQSMGNSMSCRLNQDTN